jgi:hypothetical protein
MAVVVIAITGCSERPPPRVIPKTATEREVLLLADQFVESNKMVDYATPIEIAPGNEPQTYVVTYFTRKEEMALLGPGQLIVDLSSKKVEPVMRD